MADYTTNWSRSHFQALPVINTQPYTAVRKNYATQDSESERAEKKKRKTAMKIIPNFDLCSCTKLKYSSFLYLKSGNSTGCFFKKNNKKIAKAHIASRQPINRFKAGVHVKAVSTWLNTAFLPISRSRFKQR